MSNQVVDVEIPRNTRVIWTEDELRRIVLHAVDIQRHRPELAGLRLIRAAIAMLPTHRQRGLISLSQVPWFEPGVETESRLREMETGTGDEAERSRRVTAAVVREIVDAIRGVEAAIERLAKRIKPE